MARRIQTPGQAQVGLLQTRIPGTFLGTSVLLDIWTSPLGSVPSVSLCLPSQVHCKGNFPKSTYQTDPGKEAGSSNLAQFPNFNRRLRFLAETTGFRFRHSGPDRCCKLHRLQGLQPPAMTVSFCRICHFVGPLFLSFFHYYCQGSFGRNASGTKGSNCFVTTGSCVRH